MKRGLTGDYVPIPSAGGEKARAFVPMPLPPVPPLTLDLPTQEMVSQAMLALGRLDGLASMLPEPNIFLYSYIRKEAVLSSQVEDSERRHGSLSRWGIQTIANPPWVCAINSWHFVDL